MEQSLKDKYAGIYGGDPGAGNWTDSITAHVNPDDPQLFQKWLKKRAKMQGYTAVERYVNDEIFIEISHLNRDRGFAVENSAYLAPKKVAQRLHAAYQYWLDVDKPVSDEIEKADKVSGINTDF